MIVLGRITAPYGVQGWVQLHVFGDDPLALKELPGWWLSANPDATEGWKEVALEALREQGGSVVARLAGVADRTAAEKLKGLYVGAPREVLPATAEDEFYWGDLVGLAVVNEQGETLGKVSGLLESGAHDVLVVQDADVATQDGKTRERLLPFVAKVIRKVDVAGGTARVDWERDW